MLSVQNSLYIGGESLDGIGCEMSTRLPHPAQVSGDDTVSSLYEPGSRALKLASRISHTWQAEHNRPLTGNLIGQCSTGNCDELYIAFSILRHGRYSFPCFKVRTFGLFIVKKA